MSGLRRFLSSWQNILGLAIVAFYFFLAIAAPRLSPMVDPKNPSAFQSVGRITDRTPHPPSSQAPLGTLPGQVDVLHGLVWGSRSALAFGLTVALLSALIGVLVGAAGAYLGGRTNYLSMRVTDAFLAVPLVAGVFFFQQVFSIIALPVGSGVTQYNFWKLVTSLSIGPIYPWLASIDPMLLAFIFFLWMPYARIVNGLVLQTKETDYVHASRAMGAGHTRIILRHLIPNSITPAIVLVARDIGMVVLLQATFTFIGMGGNSPWGEMLVIGRNWIIGPGGNPLAWWWVFIPATLALLLFGIGWNLLGDGLNDWLNPRNTRTGLEAAALPERLLEISPAGTPIIEEPKILAAEPGALPDWLVEAAPGEMTASDTGLEASALEEASTRPVEVTAQAAQGPSGAKLAAAALAGAGAAALVRSRETQEAPLVEEDTKPVRVSKPAPVKLEPELIAQAVSAPGEPHTPEVSATPNIEEAVGQAIEPFAMSDWLQEIQPEPEPAGTERLAVIAAAGLISEAAETAVKPSEEAAMPAEALPELPSWLKEIETEPASSQPAELEAWTPPPGVEPPASGVAGLSGKNLPAIDQARETLIQGDIQSAVDQYSALIRSRQSLPDVIRDLTEATYRYPVEAPVWQTLGDAYMRSDQLEEALDAYTKAEELLR